jgi:transcriptional regulator with XRE-family HTH domain
MAVISAERTQREIAAAAGLSEQRFSNIVRGVVTPTEHEERAIVRALGFGDDVDHRMLFGECAAPGRAAGLPTTVEFR